MSSLKLMTLYATFFDDDLKKETTKKTGRISYAIFIRVTFIVFDKQLNPFHFNLVFRG